jgi:hypothetical protein
MIHPQKPFSSEAEDFLAATVGTFDETSEDTG